MCICCHENNIRGEYPQGQWDVRTRTLNLAIERWGRLNYIRSVIKKIEEDNRKAWKTN